MASSLHDDSHDILYINVSIIIFYKFSTEVELKRRRANHTMVEYVSPLRHLCEVSTKRYSAVAQHCAFRFELDLMWSDTFDNLSYMAYRK